MLRVAIVLIALVSSVASTKTCDDGKTEECVAPTQNFNQETDWNEAKTIYQFHAKDINGHDVSMEKYRGHVLLVVNVASNCGLAETNYNQLEALYEKYNVSKGLRILAFPSNDFASQEPGTSADIANFAKRYNVQFDMFEKIEVNGDNAHPLWKWMKSKRGGFIVDAIKWNFTKFIVDKEGHVVSRSGPATTPFSLEDELKTYF